MNDINRILRIFYDDVNIKTVLEPPTKVEIIDKLCTIGIDNPGVDNSNIVDEIAYALTKSIVNYEKRFYSENRNLNIKFLNAIKGGYRQINLFFTEDIIPGTMESIEIYIPVTSDSMKSIVPHLYKYLMSKKISFSSKISMFNRSDNFIVEVYEKNDAIDVIKYCNDNYKDMLGILNPFIAKIGCVGVSKRLNNISYNNGISILLNEYIEECILSQRKKAYDAIDFQNFVNEMYESADNYIDKNMYYIASISLYCILTKKNILSYFSDNINFNFDYTYFNKYEEIIIDNKYQYMYNGNIVDENNNYLEFVHLQCLNCLNKIHLEQYNRPYESGAIINKKFTYKLLEQLDFILDSSSKYNIKAEYNNKEIYVLLPYLYGYIANKYKGCNESEVKNVIKTITNSMIIKKEYNNDKIYYEQNSQKIVSSIPIITTSEGTVALDIVDNTTSMCNITTIKMGKIKKYLNVYVHLSYAYLGDITSYKGKRYRYAVAKTLLDDNNCNEALERRQKDFGALFIDDRKDINKYIQFEND